MQGLCPLSWLPQIPSLRRGFPFGFFKQVTILFLTAISTLFSPIIFGTVFAQIPNTTVYLFGSQSVSTIGIVGGHTMPVNVKVDNITNSSGLAAFSFKISYNPNLVSIPDANNDYVADAGTVSIGPFLGSSGKQVRCSDGYIDIDLNDSTKRYLRFTCGTLGPTPAAPTGSGVLATVNFQTGNTIGSVPLGLVSAQLADNTANANLIANTTADTNGLVAKCADFNGDHRVTSSDILAVVRNYHTANLTYDLDADGVVSSADILIAVREYMKTC